jgi:hypothetical protein
MTEATQQALWGLRDLSMIQWYVIPLMAIVFYVYTREIKEARKTGDCFAILVISLKSMKAKLTAVGVIYTVPVIMNILALGFWGWVY